MTQSKDCLQFLLEIGYKLWLRWDMGAWWGETFGITSKVPFPDQSEVTGHLPDDKLSSSNSVSVSQIHESRG